MCQEINKMDMNTNKKVVSYSIKKLLKQVFKQHKSQHLAELQNLENDKKAESMESFESYENNLNDSIESDSASMESYENDMNERLFEKQRYEMEEFNYTTTVPVHFVRTEQGTFFWTAYNQVACMQDRWAQA